ncbi:MAG: type II toxin-antitoxin system RelE/ParE family toxin [Coriobacteriia bacterium]
MASYEVFITASARREIEDLEKAYRIRVMRVVGDLRFDPRPAGCEKLSSLDRYRVRVGPYRIVYTIDDAVVTVVVVKVGHRRDVYRRGR